MTYYSKCHNDCLFSNLLLFLCFKYNKEFIYWIALRKWNCCQKEYVYSNLIFHIIPYFISYISIHLLIFFIQFSIINNYHLRIQSILLRPFYPASSHYQILSWSSIFLVFIRNQIKLTI